MFRLFILLFLVTLSLTFTTNQAQSSATPTTRFVSTTDLQGAIDASKAGDQIWVAAGIYKPTNTEMAQFRLSYSDGG